MPHRTFYNGNWVSTHWFNKYIRPQIEAGKLPAQPEKHRKPEAKPISDEFLVQDLPKRLGFPDAQTLFEALRDAMNSGRQPEQPFHNVHLTKQILRWVRARHSKGQTDAEIARGLRLRISTVRYARHRIGLKGHPGNPNTR